MSLLQKLQNLESQAQSDLSTVQNPEQFEQVKNKYLSRKGLLAELTSELKSVPSEEKPIVGKEANRIKNVLTALFEDKEKNFQKNSSHTNSLSEDVTMPSLIQPIGTLHPLTQITNEICQIFSRLGFTFADGPEMETEFYNFEALNIPANHPSRDAVDTFYLENGKLLRSQTSTVQIRVMQERKPPFKIIAPGKVYRPDATDATHSFMFHQIEGLMVDEKVSFADLKGVLLTFAKSLFGKDVTLQFRPHFFPFTEPSAEVDISCNFKTGSGMMIKSKTGWLEILGAGMVHPKVLTAAGINPKKYSGFAFGLGVERIAMLKYGIKDIRLFYENDIRFLNQFA